MTRSVRSRSRVVVAVIAVVLAGLLVLALWPDPPPGTGEPVRPPASPSPKAMVVESAVAAFQEPAELVPPAQAEAPPSGPTTEELIVLQGLVQDPGGAPIEGAAVWLQPVQEGEPDEGATLAMRGGSTWRAPPLASTATDGSGRFRLPIAPTDRRVRLRAEADGHMAWWMGIPLSGAWRHRSEDEIEITLPLVIDLFGRTLDAATGNPLPGVSVSHWGEQVSSDESGAYTLPIPLRQEVGVEARKEGYVSERVTVFVREPPPTELDLHLRRGRALEIVVVDFETGEPVAGAAVSTGTASRDLLARTDALGGGCTLHVEDGLWLSLHVSAPDRATLSWSTTIEPDTPSQVRLPLPHLAAFEGRVTDGNDRPLANASLFAAAEPGDRVDLAADEMRAFGLTGGVSYVRDLDQSISSDSEGLYRLPVLASESTLRVVAGSADHVADMQGPFVLATPGQVQRVDFVLEQGATIRGRVRRDGQPLPGLFVDWRADTASYGWGNTITDEQGSYELSNVRPGPVRLSVSERRQTPETVSLAVAAGETYEQDFALLPREEESPAQSPAEPLPREEGILRLRLLDADTQEPLPAGNTGDALAWRDSGTDRFRKLNGSIDLAGVLELTLPLSVVDLSFAFHDDGYRPQVVESLAVSAAENPDPLPVELVRGLDVRFPTQGQPDRDALAGHLVFVLAEDQLDQLHPTGPGERFTHRINGVEIRLDDPALYQQMLWYHATDTPVVRGLAPGRHHIRCVPDDLVFEPNVVHVDAEATTHPVSWHLNP